MPNNHQSAHHCGRMEHTFQARLRLILHQTPEKKVDTNINYIFEMGTLNLSSSVLVHLSKLGLHQLTQLLVCQNLGYFSGIKRALNVPKQIIEYVHASFIVLLITLLNFKKGNQLLLSCHFHVCISRSHCWMTEAVQVTYFHPFTVFTKLSTLWDISNIFNYSSTHTVSLLKTLNTQVL